MHIILGRNYHHAVARVPDTRTHTVSHASAHTVANTLRAQSNSKFDSSTDVPLCSFFRLVFCGVPLYQQPELTSEPQWC